MQSAKRTISISEARKRIFDIAEEVQAPHKVYTLTADGKPKAVIMSAEEYESMIETLEVQRIFPNLDKDIAEVEEAFKTGAWKNWTTLEQLERKWGLVVAEKPKKKYGIQPSSDKKSRKSPR